MAHVNAVCWVLEKLRKHGFFAKLKSCRFYKDKVCFLGYIVLAQEVQMEEERIEVVKNWPKPKSMRDIQVFLGFANFYQHFIQSFSKIVGPFTSMLIIRQIQSAENLLLLVNIVKDAEVGVGDGNCEDKIVERSPCSKNLNSAGYLTPKARLAFTQLRKTFINALILQHFDLECYIWIETNSSGYAIDRVLSQLILNNLGQ